jgi:iron(III) transport system substrate-binding protein
MNTRRTLAAAVAVVAAVALGACRGKAPSLPEVRVHATVGDAHTAVLVQAARASGIAAVRVVATPAEAEVLWLGEPAEVLALGALVRPAALPAHADVDTRLLDGRGRFLPVGARARVLLVNPKAKLPFEPQNLRDLADARASGRVALVGLDSDEGAATVAALRLTFGEESVTRFVEALAKNDPQVAASDAEVRDRVAQGDAAFGLVGSESAAAGAASAAGLQVVFPDQQGRGAVLLPTAVALTTNASGEAAKLAHWLAGLEAEQVLVARIPGLMPLRDGVPVPVGVQPTLSVRARIIDWDRFAEQKRQAREALKGWPDEQRR